MEKALPLSADYITREPAIHRTFVEASNSEVSVVYVADISADFSASVADISRPGKEIAETIG